MSGRLPPALDGAQIVPVPPGGTTLPVIAFETTGGSIFTLVVVVSKLVQPPPEHPS